MQSTVNKLINLMTAYTITYLNLAYLALVSVSEKKMVFRIVNALSVENPGSDDQNAG